MPGLFSRLFTGYILKNKALTFVVCIRKRRKEEMKENTKR
jgi:hypothetical protein